MKFYYLFLTSFIVNTFFVLAQTTRTKTIPGISKTLPVVTKTIPDSNAITLTHGRVKIVGSLPTGVVDAKLDCYGSVLDQIAEHRDINELCDEISSTEKSCYVKTQKADSTLFYTASVYTGIICNVFTKKEGITTFEPTTSTKTIPTSTKTIPTSTKTIPNTNAITLTSGGIQIVGSLPTGVVDAKLDCFNVIPSQMEAHKKINELCDEISSTEKSCYVRTQEADSSLFSTVKYATGRSCAVFTKKEGITTFEPTTTTSTKTIPTSTKTIPTSTKTIPTSTKTIPNTNAITLTSGGIQIVGSLPTGVVDAKLDCFNVIPSQMEAHKKINELCDEISSTEKSCYVRTQEADSSLFSTVKYATGRSCAVFTKKEGITTFEPTTTTSTKTIPTSTKTIPNTNTITLTSGGIQIVGSLPTGVVDAKLDCFNVIPSQMEAHKKINELCDEISSTEKSCYVRTQEADSSLFSTVKYATGRSCAVFTKKEGITTFEPTTSTKTIPTSTKTIPTSTKTIPTSTKTVPNVCTDVTVTKTIKEKVTVKETITVTVTDSSSPTNVPANCAAKWAQCGGEGFNGPTCCQPGSTCHEVNRYYSQCI